MFHRSARRTFHKARWPHFGPCLATALAVALVTTWPADADWLVTRYGDEIEIQGRWQIEEGWVYFTDKDDREDLLPLEDIDWEASQRASARITLYLTSWCGYCRAASDLLKELDADFVEKDVESDEEARKEHLALTGGHGGVPVLKAQSRVVAGFSAEAIRSLVKQQKIWISQQPRPAHREGRETGGRSSGQR